MVCVWFGIAPGAAIAQISDNVVKIGVLTDMSGPYADLAGPGSVTAAQLAVEDFGGKVLGAPIEVISADHQQKADVGASIARNWLDTQHVDMITDLTGSSVALAVQQLTKQAGKVALFTAPSTTELTGKQCSPTGIHWVYDSYTNAVGPVSAMIKQGYDSWYFITPDYAAGYSLESNGMAAVKRFGGKILGSVRHPFPSADMSSFLLTAKASGAKAIMLSNSGSDLIATIKQANEFGLTENGGPALVAPQVFITDIDAVGLEMAQGMTFVTAFYWDRDDKSRAFAKRFFARQKKMPTMAQAGAYSAVTHYLRAIQAAGTDDGKTVVAKMKEMPVDDLFGSNGTIREDGRKTHDMLLVTVKKPSESKYPWDYYKILAVIPAKDIFLPLNESECPLVKHP